MEKKYLLFDGNEKQVWSTVEENKIIFQYKDVTTAYGGIKRAFFAGIGCLNNRISAMLFEALENEGIPTHFISLLDERQQLCHKVKRIDITVGVHNRICGSLASTLGVEDGFKPENTIIDYQYDIETYDNPQINEDHAVALGLATYDEMNFIRSTAKKANEVLGRLLKTADIELVDMKMEFGRTADGKLMVCDELSPDRCRFWDLRSGEKLDKDRFRNDLGDIYKGYETVLNRLIAAMGKIKES